MSEAKKPCIHIVKARQHNLRNISLDIPRDELVVVCGPSGSGKSTLAFDIVYAEGQRRYVESLSTYARQFLPQMDKPDVEKIEGLSPAISLEQQSVSRNPRSTVGTVTEIYDFLRVFYARLGRMYCPQCGRPIEARAADEIIADILALPQGEKFMVLAPLVELQKGTHQDKFKKLKAEGFARVRVDGAFHTLDALPELDKNKKHSIDLVVDRLVNKEGLRGRLADSVELALRFGDGRLVVHRPGLPEAEQDAVQSTTSVCPHCHISLPALSPQLFSFNGPQGACPRCVGLGGVDYFEPRLIAPNMGLALNAGALLPWTGKSFARYAAALKALGKRFRFSLDTPLEKFSEDALAALQKINHLVGGGALVDGGAVAHERDRRQVIHSPVLQRGDGDAHLLEGHARVQELLNDLENEDVPEGVEALRSRAASRANRGLEQAGASPVVQLTVGDAGSVARNRPTVADLVRFEALERVAKKHALPTHGVGFCAHCGAPCGSYVMRTGLR